MQFIFDAIANYFFKGDQTRKEAAAKAVTAAIALLATALLVLQQFLEALNK